MLPRTAVDHACYALSRPSLGGERVHSRPISVPAVHPLLPLRGALFTALVAVVRVVSEGVRVGCALHATAVQVTAPIGPRVVADPLLARIGITRCGEQARDGFGLDARQLACQVAGQMATSPHLAEVGQFTRPIRC